ncbi:MAG: nucleotidyltransferase domain-containing protein [candidate division WOR-3 bacterium]
MNQKKMHKIIDELVERIKKSYNPQKIILFGSYAYGSQDKESDIDILIIKETDERPIDRRIRVRRLVNLKEPIAFSSIVLLPSEVEYLCKIRDPFIKEILEKGKVLYG